MPTLAVKLDEQSSVKVQVVASQQGVTPQAFMVRAIESAVAQKLGPHHAFLRLRA